MWLVIVFLSVWCMLLTEQEGEGEWFFNENEVMANVIGANNANNHVDLAEVRFAHQVVLLPPSNGWVALF